MATKISNKLNTFIGYLIRTSEIDLNWLMSSSICLKHIAHFWKVGLQIRSLLHLTDCIAIKFRQSNLLNSLFILYTVHLVGYLSDNRNKMILRNHNYHIRLESSIRHNIIITGEKCREPKKYCSLAA